MQEEEESLQYMAKRRRQKSGEDVSKAEAEPTGTWGTWGRGGAI